MTIKLDVSQQDQSLFDKAAKTAVEKSGKIEFLVNNAGHGRITNFEETSEQSIKEVFEVNLFGTMRVTRAVLLFMRKQRSGHIFNISSGAGYCGGPTAYHSSKFAVTGFSCSLAFELALFGIRVTNVAPGMFRIGFYDGAKIKTDCDIHIADYDKCRWQTDFMKENSKGNQVGNPEKLGNLLYEVTYSDTPAALLARR
ncbi:MAG TPA: SDR family NAD(P)-dependent oxidoreductase [Candidatus Ornithoclostridium excrementipullorum]|nr:SDR family NAD(P)-dependent oxidoreductase [Candidatus Ornithoclostridium excrementipullorum]